MKLKKFNLKNCHDVRLRKMNSPKIKLGNGGSVLLNCAATMALGLKDGDTVEFAQDEEYPSDWRLLVTGSPDGFKLKQTKRPGELSFQNYTLVHTIAASVAPAMKFRHILMGLIPGGPEAILDTRHPKVTPAKEGRKQG